MNILDQVLDQVSPLPPDSRAKLQEIVAEVTFPKGHLLLRADQVEKRLFFIKTGIARAYSRTAEHEITFWFGREGDAILSMRSYVQGQKAYEDIELLEASILYQINHDELQLLFVQDIAIANWGRKLAEKELVKTEERLISRQFRTATERYQELITQNPDLIQRVSLGHIASYLGITQVSLSRIRAGVR